MFCYCIFFSDFQKLKLIFENLRASDNEHFRKLTKHLKPVLDKCQSILPKNDLH